MPDRATGRGLIVAASSSGSGKTLVTLGLLRALRRRGVPVASAKSGPDYIDPSFHTLAGSSSCVNLDGWAMRPELVRGLASSQAEAGMLLVEGAMGLFDGAADGSGSAAALARELMLPAVLVVDVARQSQSVAALVHGFTTFPDAPGIAGVILNRVASTRHEAMLRTALENVGANVLGAVARDDGLVLPSRHLGLVQAGELGQIEAFIERAADAMEAGIDLGGLVAAMRPVPTAAMPAVPAPDASVIAVARDAAFAFSYPHHVRGWKGAGRTLRFFSPLADEAPDEGAGHVYLPGGYPELHAGRLAGNRVFLEGLRQAAARGATVHGECGGYMALGRGLIDAEGREHAMAGLLDLVTSFARRRRTLGYRRWRTTGGVTVRGHEHHHCTAVREEGQAFAVPQDALGQGLGPQGLRRDNVSGSWLHLVDHEAAA